MKISREIKNQTGNGSAYIDCINGVDGIYTVRMRFSFDGRIGYEEYALKTNATPNLTDNELELVSPNGRLELVIEQNGEMNHFSIPRLEITRRLFRLPP